MAKKSQRRPVRYDKDQLGCMWGFISIFGLRHGRFTQKLLSDRRRKGKLAAGVGNINKLDRSTGNDNNVGTFDGDESRNRKADADKPIVKKLIQEEMINEQNNKKEINNTEVEPMYSHAKKGSPRKKASRRMRKSRKNSSDSISDVDAPESFSSEQPSHQNLEHQSTISLDVDKVMEELRLRIRQRSTSSMNDEQPEELEGQLREAIKFLMGQKLNKGNQISKDGEIHPSKELMDALQILGSDSEMFVKHIQDPNSLLVKCIQNFPVAQLDKDEDSMSLAGSTLSEQELGNVSRSDEFVDHKQRRFFRRNVKTQGRSMLNGENISRAPDRIVILKPGSTGCQVPEVESTIGSSPESHYVLRNKGLNERIGSQFFLTEIKRKLKYAMGKEHHRIPKGVYKGSGEIVGITSPTKDHFFTEKIARPVSVKKAEKTSKLKDSELGTEHRSADLQRQKVNNIYIEAKKHLSDILSIGDENLDSSSGDFTKTLGKVLSLPEYNSSPFGSPGRNLDHGFVTAQMRFVDSDKCTVMTEDSSLNQDGQATHIGQTTKSSECQPCISDESSNNIVQSPSFSSNIVIEQIHDNEVNKTPFSGGDGMNSKGDVEIMKTIEIVVQDERNVLDAPCQPHNDSSVNDEDQNRDDCEIFTAQLSCRHMTEHLDSPEDNQLTSSPLASPSNSTTTMKVEDRETAINILERPSPVSVLEPLYIEDDISPASIRSLAGEIPVHPHRIQLEECDYADADQSIQVKSTMEDRESIFEYVKAVLQTSDVNWNELSLKSLSTDQLLDLSLCDEIESSCDQLYYEQNLLFDLVNEALLEICGHYFGRAPWASFVKPYILLVPDKKNMVHEVWEGILWHLMPLPLPHTLDQTVRKDMAKSGTWMDLRFDTDSTCVEMGDDILDDLMEDTVLSCVNNNPERVCPMILAELKESERTANSENGCSLLADE